MNEKDLARIVRRVSRTKSKMPTGGTHGTRKGAKGYTRKVKHRNKQLTTGG